MDEEDEESEGLLRSLVCVAAPCAKDSHSIVAEMHSCKSSIDLTSEMNFARVLSVETILSTKVLCILIAYNDPHTLGGSRISRKVRAISNTLRGSNRSDEHIGVREAAMPGSRSDPEQRLSCQNA